MILRYEEACMLVNGRMIKNMETEPKSLLMVISTLVNLETVSLMVMEHYCFRMAIVIKVLGLMELNTGMGYGPIRKENNMRVTGVMVRLVVMVS
jgi:hypothetical protein